MTDCWICGALADSAEHMITVSDFKSIFGGVTNQAPVYLHSRNKINDPVHGAKSNKLKFTPSICCYCNNSRTQLHDLAWQKFSESMRSMRPSLVAGSRIPLLRIFPANIKQSMLYVHLYFLKLFGCYAVEYDVPLPIGHFALCILNNVAHPSDHISFVQMAPRSQNEILVGPIRARNVSGKTVSANWFYVVGTLGIAVSYNEPGHPRLTRDRGWHPSDIGTQVRTARQK